MANTFALVCGLFVLVSAVENRADADAPDSEAKAMQTRDFEAKILALQQRNDLLEKRPTKDLEAKNLILQQRNDELEKSLNKQTEPKGESLQSLMIKELEEESIKLATEKRTNKRLRGEIKKLKSKNANFKQMQRQNDKPKNTIMDPYTFDCAGQTIVTFSRNVRGFNSVFKNSNLAAYKKGFSDLQEKSFWIGLERLHQLTSTGTWDLLVRFKWGEKYGQVAQSCINIGDEVDPLSGTWGNAKWPNFKVEGASTNYKWHYGPMKESYNFRCDVLYKTGPSGDHDGQPFSLYEGALSCGGFWYAEKFNFAPTAVAPQFLDFCTVPGKTTSYSGLEAIMAIVKVE